jgi:hypothetical protein
LGAASRVADPSDARADHPGSRIRRAAAGHVFAFVKVRSRRRSVVTLLAPVTAGAAAAPADRRTPVPPARPAVKASSATGWLFYDPTKPLEKISP